MEYITESQFDNLFNSLITIAMNNNDQDDTKLFESIFDIYELKQYIPQIIKFEQRIRKRIFMIKYKDKEMTNLSDNYLRKEKGYYFEVSNEVDLNYTLYSFRLFFTMYNRYKEVTTDLIDISSVNNIIIPSLNYIRDYLTKIEENNKKQAHDTWYQNYNLVLEFIENFDRLPKPIEYYKDINIGYWLHNQRESIKGRLPLTMDQEQISLIQNIYKKITRLVKR